MVLSAGLMSLAYAPAGQFYLAWIALVPWLLAVRSAPTAIRAGLWGWFGGSLILLCNDLYLLPLRVLAPPGLAVYLAVAAALCASLTHAAGLLELRPGASAFTILAKCAFIAAIWTALEWVRGNYGVAIPWLYVSNTQIPALAMCQIADLTGAYGVSFCVVLVNALFAMTILHRAHRRPIVRAWIVAGFAIVAINVYGLVRLSQGGVFAPGPRVAAIQPNDRRVLELLTLERQRDLVAYHLKVSAEAVSGKTIDLIAWPESSMPALNDEAFALFNGMPAGTLFYQAHRGLLVFVHKYNASVIAGGQYMAGSPPKPGERPVIAEFRNSAYFYDRFSETNVRYDKARPMPFGENVPLQHVPGLNRIMRLFTPNRDEYQMTPGSEDALTVFTLRAHDLRDYRFVAPICWDDLDSLLIRKMLRPADGSSAKRADFMVNLSNEAWFDFGEPAQHLNCAVYRTIENRTPMLRSVNGGISAAIDSCGRVLQSLPINSAGSISAQVTLDSRLTFYTRFGDLFVYACFVPTVLSVLLAMNRWNQRRLLRRTGTAALPGETSSALPGSGTTMKSI